MSYINNEKNTILVIDDNSTNFQQIASLLDQQYNLILIENVEEWLQQNSENSQIRIDLILINYINDSLNGLKHVELLHHFPQYEVVPVIMYSKIRDEQVVETAFSLGVFDFIEQPFRANDLKSKISVGLEVLEDRLQKKAMNVINNMLGNSLQQKNRELEQKNRELMSFNQQLSAIVDEKTLELQLANDNLKSYSQNLEQLIEKKTAENLQLHKNAIIGDLVSGLVHNLRTPLSVIKGQTELLVKTTARALSQADCACDLIGKEIDKRSKHIQDSVLRLEDMLKNLMLRKREDSITEKTKVSLNDFLEKELVFLNSNTDFKHYVIKEFLPEADLPQIFVVVSDLSQVLYNLINNSMDAMWQQNEKKITFTTRSDDDWVYLEVTDNGPGIAPENMSKLFDPFFTTKPSKDKAVNNEPAGTGLGLHSVKQLVGANDGNIRYFSELGKGTKAEISFRKIN